MLILLLVGVLSSLVVVVVFVHEADPLVITLMDALFCLGFRYTAELCNFVIMKFGFGRSGKKLLLMLMVHHEINICFQI